MTWRLARIGITLAVLGGVIWLAGPANLALRLGSLNPAWMAMAVAVLVVQIWLSSLRWHLTAQALGTPVARAWALGEYHLSVLANTVLPGGVLGDLARAARARGAMGGLGPAAASVVIERLAGQVALGVAAVVGVVWWSMLHVSTTSLPVLGGVLAGLALLALGAWSLPSGWRALVVRAWTGHVVAQLLLSALILGCNLLGVWAAAQAAGVPLGPGQAMFVIPLTLLSMLVPLTVNGWGLREGVAAVLWPMIGVMAADAVAASIAFGIAALAAALTGLVPLAARLLMADKPTIHTS
jgi:hypothetical protein